MSAPPNATAPRSFVRALALACAATLLPSLSHAAVHRAAKSQAHAAPAHHAAVKSAAHAKPNRELVHARAAEAKSSRSVKKGRRTETAEAAPVKTRHGREAIEAARAELRSARSGHEADKPLKATASRPEPPSDTTEAVADRATQDRVHAWYKAHSAAVVKAVADKPVADAAPAKPKQARTDIQPDLSPTPRKATVADFDRALQQQRQAILAAQAENQSRTTDEDDAAEAATQIPRTAPTARVAAPFVHGDLLTEAADSMETASTPQQVTLPAAKLDRHLEKHPDTKPDAEVLARTPAGLDNASPSRLRTIAAETAYTDTPKVNLPKPVTIQHETAPAVAAVKAAARKPELDPGTTQALTDEAFDDDGSAAAPAKTSPVLTAKASPAMKHAVADEDEDNEATRATTTPVNVDLYDGNGRLKLIPPMKGSHEILVHQNQMAVADGLDRIQDDAQLQEMRRYKLLVSLPDTDAIMVNDTMPANRRYARPWTVRFLNDLAKAHYARFHTPLVITSAVRTVEFQRHLIRINGNAAPWTGDVASPHLYGQAVDLGKRGMSLTEIAWMRAYLTPVEAAGKIDVEEEFQQACFHISVYRRYLGLPPRKNTPPADPIPQRRYEVVKASPTPSKRRRHISALLAAGVR